MRIKEVMIFDRIDSIFIPNQIAERYRLKAVKYFDQRKYEEAISLFSDAIHLCPDNPNLYCNRAAAYNNMGRYDEAVADFSTCLDLKFHDPAWVLFYRAQIQGYRKKFRRCY
jgi:tetratricopeptide (TPR) repeat protein